MPMDPLYWCCRAEVVERGSRCELGVVDPFEGFGGGPHAIRQRFNRPAREHDDVVAIRIRSRRLRLGVLGADMVRRADMSR